MKRLRFISLPIAAFAVALITLLAGSGTAQALMLKFTVEDLTNGSDRVVVGSAANVTSQWNPEKTRIYSTVTLSVEDTWKGTSIQSTVTFTVPGGTVDGITEWDEDAAIFKPGERAVVFLKQSTGASYEVYGQGQGKLPVVQGLVQGNTLLTQMKTRVSNAVRGITPASTGNVSSPTFSSVPSGPVTLPFSTNLTAQTTVKSSDNSTTRDGWTYLINDGFESGTLNAWQPYTPSGTLTWATRTNNPYAGSYSAYCAGAGTLYANNMDTRLYAGPFSLADATQADLSFYTWLQTAANDGLIIYMSVDGTNFYSTGYIYGGPASTWLSSADLLMPSLQNWPTLGNLCGQPSVYIAFRFVSDASVVDQGVFLDNIVLRKYVPGSTAPQITGISPSSASAGTDSPVTITGNHFVASAGSVNFFYQTGNTITGSVVSWSDTSITVKVPTAIINGYPASAGSGPVYVHTATSLDSNYYPFTVTFSYGGVKWDGASPTVNYYVNENSPDCFGEGSAFQSAAASWNAALNKGFNFHYAGSTTNTTYAKDGFNAILWGVIPGNTSTIARAVYWFSGNTFVEADIEFNEYFSWSTAGTVPSNQMDVQTIATHELGHWLNLRDLYGDATGYPQDSAKVMFGYGGNGLNKRTLQPEDQAGIQWIYPLLSSPPAVTTDNATTVTSNSAVLNGTLTDKGTASSVTVSFLYGLTNSYGSEITLPASVNATGPFSILLSPLSSNITYHYQAKAVGDSTAYGVDKSFTTAATNMTLTVNTAPGGTVTQPGIGTFSYVPGTVVNLVAAPDSNNRLVHWAGDNATIANPLSASTTITMSGNYTITATFGSAIPFRTLPAIVVRGQSFPVTLTAYATSDNVNSIGFSDNVPVGWTAAAISDQCSPHIISSAFVNGQMGILWDGPFPAGTVFTGVYQATVPADAALGQYTFAGGLEYYVGNTGPFTAILSGDTTVQVVNGAPLTGYVFEANGLPLSSATVAVDGGLPVNASTSGNYTIRLSTGLHTIVASATGFYDLEQSVNVTDLNTPYTCDFKGATSLVPKAPDLSYVLRCINKWKFPSSDGTGLDLSKILDVINSWKFPT